MCHSREGFPSCFYLPVVFLEGGGARGGCRYLRELLRYSSAILDSYLPKAYINQFTLNTIYSEGRCDERG